MCSFCSMHALCMKILHIHDNITEHTYVTYLQGHDTCPNGEESCQNIWSKEKVSCYPHQDSILTCVNPYKQTPCMFHVQSVAGMWALLHNIYRDMTLGTWPLPKGQGAITFESRVHSADAHGQTKSSISNKHPVSSSHQETGLCLICLRCSSIGNRYSCNSRMELQ